MMLMAPPGIPGHHFTEALSKRHPKGAIVASLQLFMIKINRNRVRDHRDTDGCTEAEGSAQRVPILRPPVPDY